MHGFVIEFIERQILGLKQLNTESILSLTNSFKLVFQQQGENSRLLAQKLIENVEIVESALEESALMAGGLNFIDFPYGDPTDEL